MAGHARYTALLDACVLFPVAVCDAQPPSTSDGRPLLVSVARLYKDPNNPRTEFPGAALE